MAMKNRNTKQTAQSMVNMLLKAGYTRQELIAMLKAEKRRVMQQRLNLLKN